ncbi:hypothetical protein LTR17_000455 [Elasticomyces elasticus]|nr:hypothetical protein LTR17_000455 [Elasticomyces elasticus]
MAPSILTVAAELRNAICELVILDDLHKHPSMHVGASGHFTNQPALLAVCQQLRQEALPVYLNHAPRTAKDLSVTVHNFDFSALMTYLDSLDAGQRAALAANRSLRVKISLPATHEQCNWAGVRQWTQYCGSKPAIVGITGTTSINNAYCIDADVNETLEVGDMIFTDAVSWFARAFYVDKGGAREWKAMVKTWDCRVMAHRDDAASEGPQEPSPLLRLAAELRNTIYELVIAQTKIIEPRTNGHFTNKPGLLAACHQIRLEAVPIFLHLAPLIARSVFEIRNFDFRKVMTYIDTLDNAQCTALGRRRMLLIKVTIDTKDEAKTEKGLRRWLQYCSTKLAGHLDTSNYARQQSYVFPGTIPEYVGPMGYKLSRQLEPDSVSNGHPRESDLVMMELQGITAAWSARNSAIQLRRSFDKWID